MKLNEPPMTTKAPRFDPVPLGSSHVMKDAFRKTGLVQSCTPILIVTAQPVLSKSQKLAPRSVSVEPPAVGQLAASAFQRVAQYVQSAVHSLVAAPAWWQPEMPSTRAPDCG